VPTAPAAFPKNPSSHGVTTLASLKAPVTTLVLLSDKLKHEKRPLFHNRWYGLAAREARVPAGARHPWRRCISGIV